MMLNLRFVVAFGCGVGLALLSGCATLDSRIEKERATFMALSPADQQRIHEARIELGDVPAVVFMALGSPSRKSREGTGEAAIERWEYDDRVIELEENTLMSETAEGGLRLRSDGVRGGRVRDFDAGATSRLASAQTGPRPPLGGREWVLMVAFVGGQVHLIENRLMSDGEVLLSSGVRR